MQILIYSKAFAPDIGGVETYTQQLALGLAAEGHNVVVATRSARAGYDDDSQPFRIVRLGGFGLLALNIRRADIVHVAGATIVPMLLCMLLRRPFLVEHHNYQSICLNGLLLQHPGLAACDGRYLQRDYVACLRCQTAEWSGVTAWRRLLLMPLRRWLCTRATANVGVTAHVRERIQLPRSTFIHHGLPVQHSAQPKQADGGPVTFAYVGRMVAEKGLHTLLAAAKKMHLEKKTFELLMIGDGPMLQSLKEIAADLPQVRFTGFIQPEILPAMVEDVDVLILPSIWEETAGLVAIEQMHRGRAVIAADIGGLAEIVGDVARKFTPGNVDALVDAMMRYVEHPDHVSDDGNSGLRRARSLFKTEDMVQAHLALYRQLITVS